MSITRRELVEILVEHILGQRCSACYNDYLYDTGRACQNRKKMQVQLSNMHEVTLYFRDCPTTSETCLMAQDITDCGGKLKNPLTTHGDKATAEIGFEVDDFGAFMEKFRKTEAYKHMIKH